MHTIEKAAEIYLKAKSVGIVNTITDDDLRVLADAFGVTLNPEFL
jgi:rhamnulose-1-phosphate aldolase